MFVCSRTGVTVSFFNAELYCSSERKGSPLGNVSSGDLVAISQTPSYHSSGHRPEDRIGKKTEGLDHFYIKCLTWLNVRISCNISVLKKCITEQTWALYCKSHDNRVEPEVPKELLQTWLCFLNWRQPLSQLKGRRERTSMDILYLSDMMCFGCWRVRANWPLYICIC